MKDRQNLDELFKSKFQDFEPELDKRGLWLNLSKRLGNSTGRSILFFFIILVVLAGITGAATGVFDRSELEVNSNSIAGQNQHAHVAKEHVAPEILSQEQVIKDEAFETKNNEGISGLIKSIEHSINTGEKSNYRDRSVSKIKSKDNERVENQESTVYNNSLNISGIPASSMDESELRINSLSLRKPQLMFSQERLEIPFAIKKRKWSEECKVKEPSYFYFSPYVSGLYTFQSIAALSDASTYEEKWKLYDEVLPGYAAGLLLGYELPNGLNVEAGLEWQQVFEKLLFYQMVTETIKVYSDSAYYWEDDNGVKQYFGDTISTERTYERKVQSLKRHNIWSIPVGIGYNFDFQRVRLGVQAGAVFHLDHQFKGRVYSPSGSFDYLLPSDKGKIYNPKLGITWFASLRMYFLQSDRVEWYIAPGFRYNRNSWLQGDTGLELFNKFGELKVGAKVYF